MRIVAGEFKGRTLHGPDGKATRPTSDKVREALFSILGDVAGLRALDLFAGTGAVGIEAVSRGAESAVLVERDRRMIAVIEQNLSVTAGPEDDRITVLRGNALRFVGDYADAPFDLVFLDPPYADAPAIAPKLSDLLPRVLAPGATVATESDRRSPLVLDENAFPLRSEHRYGDTLLRIFNAP